MNWLRNLFGRSRDSIEELQLIKHKFDHFRRLLDRNNRALKILSDMEEKAQGEYLFDINYIRSSLAELQAYVHVIIEEMIALGGEKYERLRDKFVEIDNRVTMVFPSCRPIVPDEYTQPFSQITRERACSVGSKNAQMGELKSRLKLPVPDGFAISGWAYKEFLISGDLHSRINELVSSLDLLHPDNLQEVSKEAIHMVREAAVPEALANAISKAATELKARTGIDRFALRSSAIGEDTQFSFAGQYATRLNVPIELVVDVYRDILTSKFSPQAIYYYLSHALTESEMAMSVGCVAMINARAAGVVYSKNPIDPTDGTMLVSAVLGLGKLLVDGSATPDQFQIERDTGKIVHSTIATKTTELVMSEMRGSVPREVPAKLQNEPAISEDEVRQLVKFAEQIEEHYGYPQDIEWAVDRNGQLYILQARPLRVLTPSPSLHPIDTTAYNVVLKEGETVSPGAGAGRICHVRNSDDLPHVPEKAIIVAEHSFPGMITAMGRASAIVTQTGGIANHMATIAREYRIPTLGGVTRAHELPSGQMVTVDATDCVIYDGKLDELIEERQPDFDLFSDMEIFDLLRQVLKEVSPLKLLSPSIAEYSVETCQSFHDIIRYCHEMAMHEMFTGGLNVTRAREISVPLESKLPIQVNVIYVDREFSSYATQESIPEEELDSVPMKHFWSGVLYEGWPKEPHRVDTGGFASVVGNAMTRSDAECFSETSFALLAHNYMILSLRMGYHLMSIEAMCTGDAGKNYIRMQYKEGGAAADRRVRRIRLIMDVLSELGFEHQSKGDFLDTRLSRVDCETVFDQLFSLGRLTMLTKQLDMALSNDSVTEWYTNDIKNKLAKVKRGDVTGD